MTRSGMAPMAHRPNIIRGAVYGGVGSCNRGRFDNIGEVLSGAPLLRICCNNFCRSNSPGPPGCVATRASDGRAGATPPAPIRDLGDRLPSRSCMASCRFWSSNCRFIALPWRCLSNKLVAIGAAYGATLAKNGSTAAGKPIIHPSLSV